MQAPEPVNSSEPQRRLAAILAADIAGYSALMGADEQGQFGNSEAIRP